MIDISVFLKFNWLFGAPDLQFHLQRIDELYQNVLSLHFFPLLATYHFNQVGSAVMSMYPKLPLYVYVFVRVLLRNPILSYYVGNAVMVWIGLLIGYFSFLSVMPKEKVMAFIFSITYGLSSVLVSYQYRIADLGVVSALLVLPLAFSGFYHWISSGRYRMMAIGITLVLLCHVLTFIFLILTLIIFTIINIKKISKKKILSLSKAVVATVLLTSTYWLPAMVISFTTRINPPQVFSLGGMDLSQFVKDALTNNVTFGFSIIAFLGFVLGTVGYKQLYKPFKQIYWVSISYVILSSSLIPWKIFQHTPLWIIQFPWRFIGISQLGFSVLFSIGLITFLSSLSKKFSVILCVMAVTIITVGLAVNLQARYVSFELPSPEFKHPVTPTHSFVVRRSEVWDKITNKREYQNLMKFNGTYDYYPQKTMHLSAWISEDKARINGKKRDVITTTKSLPDGKIFILRTKRMRKYLTLPFILYNKNYSVSVDGRGVAPVLNRQQLLTINDVSAGRHVIKVSYNETIIFIAMILLTMSGVVWLVHPGNLMSKRLKFGMKQGVNE